MKLDAPLSGEQGTSDLGLSERLAKKLQADSNYDIPPGLSCVPEPVTRFFKSGDVFSAKNCAQYVALESGESITRNKTGGLALTDQLGHALIVEEKILPEPDMYPQITTTRFSGGVTMTESGGRQIINYPNGTEVHLDRDGFQSIRRNGVTISLGSTPDEFRGYK